MKEIKCMNPSRGQLRQQGAPCFRGATTHKGCKNLTHSPQLFGHCPESPPGMATLLTQSRVSITVWALNFKVFIIAWGDVRPGFLLQDTATLTRNLPFWDLSLLGRFQTVASISENAFFRLPEEIIPPLANTLSLQQLVLHSCPSYPQTPTHALWCATSRPAQSKFKKETQTKPRNTTQYPYEELLSSCSIALAQRVWCILIMQGINSENWFAVKFIFVNVGKLLYLSLTISFGYYFFSEILARLSIWHHKS